jgi:hypothetical protein
MFHLEFLQLLALASQEIRKLHLSRSSIVEIFSETLIFLAIGVFGIHVKNFKHLSLSAKDAAYPTSFPAVQSELERLKVRSKAMEPGYRERGELLRAGA